jgi:hypothetical protein
LARLAYCDAAGDWLLVAPELKWREFAREAVKVAVQRCGGGGGAA